MFSCVLFNMTYTPNLLESYYYSVQLPLPKHSFPLQTWGPCKIESFSSHNQTLKVPHVPPCIMKINPWPFTKLVSCKIIQNFYKSAFTLIFLDTFRIQISEVVWIQRSKWKPYFLLHSTFFKLHLTYQTKLLHNVECPLNSIVCVI